ncbi:MAG: glycosyltransferase family 87 protein [Terriglobales bacterium]
MIQSHPEHMSFDVREPGHTGSYQQRLGLAFFLLALAFIYVYLHVTFEAADARICDFRGFYSAAQMVRHGDRLRLYDLDLQAAYLFRYAPRPAQTQAMIELPFLHPAAVLVLFYPLTWLSKNIGYAIWTVLNLFLLLASTRLVQRRLGGLEGNWPLLLAILFAPVTVCILHGQTSMLVLFLYSASFVLLMDKKVFLAGCLVGLASFKFQLVLGFIAVFVLRRCWRFIAGFAVGAAVIGALSILMAGWRQMWNYPAYLRFFTTHFHFFSHISVPEMITFFVGHEPPFWVTVTWSAVVIVGAAIPWKDLETGFLIAILADVLSAHYIVSYDLVIVLLPMAVACSRLRREEQANWLQIAFAVICVLCFATVTVPALQSVPVFAGLSIGLMIWLAKAPHQATQQADVAARVGSTAV